MSYLGVGYYLTALQDIANTVNKYQSEELQKKVFQILIDQLNEDIAEIKEKGKVKEKNEQ